jgi:tetraacyldisaccharide 4'-kinase
VSRALLGCAAACYGLVVRARNACYDRGWKRIHHASVPVISVGNITAGGTGKTPFVAWLAGWLRERGYLPVILSRGYGTDPRSGLDDENRLLETLAPGVPIVVDPDRVRAAGLAVARHRAGVLIMDDGFQHRRLARDLDIVLVDALAPFGGGHLLPRGLLREPLSGLARADIIVLTRSDLAGDDALRELRAEMERHGAHAPIVLAAHRPTGLRAVAGEGGGLTLKSLADGRWAALCGIGNPEGFRLTLERLGAEIVQFSAFPDHHRYRPDELEALLRAAAASGCRGVVTTEKDAMKLERTLASPPPIPLLALEVRMDITAGRELLEEQILSAASGGLAVRR